jgi:hypothetical protein
MARGGTGRRFVRKRSRSPETGEAQQSLRNKNAFEPVRIGLSYLGAHELVWIGSAGARVDQAWDPAQREKRTKL